MKHRLLIVDNDINIVKLFANINISGKYDIDITDSVKDGLNCLRKNHYDLVVAELSLADGSGLQLLSEIKASHTATQVVMMTDNADIQSLQTSLREGAFDYLFKPVTAAIITRTIHHALQYGSLRAEREMVTNRLQAVFRGVDDAIIAMDDELRIVQFNEAASKLLGIIPSHMNQRLREKIPTIFSSIEPLLYQAVAQGTGKRVVCLVTISENNVDRTLNCTASLFNDPLSGRPGVILVVRDESRLARLERECKTRKGWHGLIGESRPMQDVYELIERLAEVDSTALITGETGTGKELAARALHETGCRHRHPFVVVNCSALPEGLIESELFGHVRGAFTNAVRDKPGRFKLADKGSIFLDEIGDLKQETQVKILRVLQEKSFEMVGDHRPIPVDVRVITATHRNLLERVREGQFREDLYYRLKVVELRMPPLREHKSDLPLLIEHFLAKFNGRFNREIRGVTAEVLEAIMDYNWPGNVRELEHLLEHAVVVAPQPILTWSNLPPEFRVRVIPPSRMPAPQPATGQGGRPLKSGEPAGEGPDGESILKVLEESHWKIKLAADKLGLSRSTLWRRMKAMGLHAPSAPDRRARKP
ncbi:MAG: sigma 54-interacting transcriptional regulator [Magnetococcales bacterium]|nr:sigma 54-interacting transcriptional regulator [Magnetococcales bacterium]